MRIAIISDVHANLEALKTCLKDIEKRNVDKIFCLGDTVQKGHHAEECVNIIREKCDVVIRGNCDTNFDDKYEKSIHNIPLELLRERVDYLNKALSEESKNYLRNLPFTYEFYMSGSLVRLFHAHPEKVSGIITAEDSYEKKYIMFKPNENTISQEVADVVIYGHLHAQFMSKMYNKTLINVGSVGNSFNVIRDDEKDSNVMETTAINYLIIEGEYGAKEYGGDLSYEFIKVNYDIDKELEDLDKNLEPDDYVKEIKEGRYRNMSKIKEYEKNMKKENRMYNLTVKDIIEQCEGELIFGNLNYECKNFCTDTRLIKEGDVFIGLKGEKFDGSSLYEQALEKGASVCVLQDVKISENVKNTYKDRTIILVENALSALQKCAKFKRSKYNIPVIAVTGSVGKTSTKDIIANVVAQKYDVLKTEGNFNNHIGLPLTILRLQNHNALVVEMGMNNLGEISFLTNIAKPNIAVITNVGTAHIGNLGSRENILKAKLEILEGLDKNGTLIINNDNDMLHNWNEQNSEYKVLSFGIENDSDFVAKNISIEKDSINYDTIFNNENVKIEVPVISNSFIYNSLSAICVGKLLDIDISKIQKGIKEFELTKSRMEICKTNTVTIINDCYNANFDSMKSAIESLAKMKGERKIAVLGDMLELGEFSQKLHSDVGKEVTKNNIDILITVGEESKNIANSASENLDSNNIFVFEKNLDAIELLKNITRQDDVILVKASNGMKFIEIVNSLKEYFSNAQKNLN